MVTVLNFLKNVFFTTMFLVVFAPISVGMVQGNDLQVFVSQPPN